MLKKHPSSTHIVIICFIISVAALINDLLYTSHNQTIIVVKQLFSPLNLAWVFDKTLSVRYNGLNYINAIFDALLLLGAMLYTVTKKAETRLIRFVFSAIFLSNIFPFIYSLIFFLFIKSSHSMSLKDILIDIVFYIVHISWIYISYRILRYFNSQKELQKDVYDREGTSITYYTEASLWQRFLHPIIDSFMAIMLFSPMIQLFIFAEKGEFMAFRFHNSLNQNIVIMLMAVLFQSLYYLITEATLGVSPAKLLTETRVINYEGNKPGFKSFAGRTFARLIPFESMTFFQHGGLHDKLPQTLVVREKKTGVHGGYYFGIVPAGIVLVLMYGSIQTKYADYKENSLFILKKERLKTELEQKLQHASNSDFFELKRTTESYSTANSRDFLKVEKVNHSDIKFSFVSVDVKYYGEPLRTDVERAYIDHKEMSPKFTFTKKALLAAMKSAAEADYPLNKMIIPIKIFGDNYTIRSIDTYYMPDIKLSESYGYGTDYFNLGLINKGWPADIIAIKVLEGDIKIKTLTPIKVTSRVQRFIEGKADGDAVDFKVNITVVDTLNRKQEYQITGNTAEGKDRTITRVN